MSKGRVLQYDPALKRWVPAVPYHPSRWTRLCWWVSDRFKALRDRVDP